MILLCLLILYVVWGSTYYAMRVALLDIPPFLMGGMRFFTAGWLLFAIVRTRGAAWPTSRQWLGSAVIGALLLGCGNGFVGAAEHMGVSSGVAATVIATMPLWAVLFGALFGERPSWMELLGLVVGFSGVLVLRRGGALDAPLLGVLAIGLAPAAWAFGSVWSKRMTLPVGPMAAATQMITAGVLMAAIGALRGESLRWPRPSALAAFVYLITFGSLIGFTAYAYLLRTVRPALATSYAYVNPVVALALGAVLGGEPFGLTHAIACGWTLIGVALVMAARKPAAVKSS